MNLNSAQAVTDKILFRLLGFVRWFFVHVQKVVRCFYRDASCLTDLVRCCILLESVSLSPLAPLAPPILESE